MARHWRLAFIRVVNNLSQGLEGFEYAFWVSIAGLRPTVELLKTHLQCWVLARGLFVIHGVRFVGYQLHGLLKVLDAGFVSMVQVILETA